MPNTDPVPQNLVKQYTWVCCQCKHDNSAVNHVQCIDCQHVFTDQCCTKNKMYINASV